uniref:3-oxoacyl-[acyl-carrier-protein] reductase n=1 Tax=Acyrthosiphon pisum TaxID=7029 RepID=A0A8R2B9D5_ACYPI|eukprot:XP_008188181.1 PREDICTED: uncharacterized oxidoreductase YgfF-like [Acyrthosiphon pisum]
MSHKIALITGGNRGLGKNGALKLAAKGVDILFTYRGHAEEAQAVVKEIEALGARAVALQLDRAIAASWASLNPSASIITASGLPLNADEVNTSTCLNATFIFTPCWLRHSDILIYILQIANGSQQDYE